MSRRIVCRWQLSGTLVADSAVHVGGLGDGTRHLRQARDGLDRPLLPGTSLAGVIEAALAPLLREQARLWRPVSRRDKHGRDDQTGEASWVRVDDAPWTPNDHPTARVEVREHVSIDRRHGVAAHGHLFTREVLPAGSRFAFRIVVDDPGGPAAEALVHRVAALLRGPGVAIGAAVTAGLGRVRLHDAELHRLDLATRIGMIAALRDRPSPVPLPDPAADGPGAHVLRVVIPWRPRGPLAVQVAADGDVVDAFPLTTTQNGAVRLELSGSAIKGPVRSHAERIARTLAGTQAPEAFLDQLRADQLGPVAALLGTGAERRAALTVSTCLGLTALPAQEWEAVRLRQRRHGTPPPAPEAGPGHDANRAALARLQQAVDDLNARIEGIRFVIAPHVAVDRWTGGAADGLLFATLEAHSIGEDSWQPIVLDLAVNRLAPMPGQPGTGEDQRAALALLLLVLRDLSDGWIGFGSGITRGMGAVTVNPADVRLHAGPLVGWLAELDQRSLADVLDDADLTGRLMAALMSAIGTLPGLDTPTEER